MYEIDKGVPPPAPRSKYPFRDLEPGDSFFVPLEGGDDIGELMSRVQSAVGQFRRRYLPDGKFTTAREDTGVRCWRLE